jgi:hypothetical protein
MIIRSILSKILRFSIVTTNKRYDALIRKPIFNIQTYAFCSSNIQGSEDELINY